MATTSAKTENAKFTLRRSDERGYEDFGWTDNWMTFSFANYYDPDWIHFGPLRVIVENHIQPHSGFPSHPHKDVEIVTYVSSGILTHGDSFGHQAQIKAGEMQHISAGSEGMVHSEENVHEVLEHNYQMWLVPSKRPTEFDYQQLRYMPEERESTFRLYVSPDGREDSMPINTDAFIYAGLFHDGDGYQHQLADGRGAWIQVVDGDMEVAGHQLKSGDGLGIEQLDKLDFAFNADTEVLLFDLRMDAPLIWK